VYDISKKLGIAPMLVVAEAKKMTIVSVRVAMRRLPNGSKRSGESFTPTWRRRKLD
jgi:hypothetical protein